MFALMLTSKGVAGVPRASLIVLAGTLTSFNYPILGVAILLGIDQYPDIVKIIEASFEKNKKIVKEYLENELPVIKMVGCDATYLLWLDCSALKVPSKVLSEFLRTNQGLFLSAGIDFGQCGDNFLRMNIACPQKLLEEGLSRLKAGVTALNIINKGLY